MNGIVAWRNHPPVATIIALLMVGTVQAAATWLITGPVEAQPFGVRARINAIGAIPMLGGDRLWLLGIVLLGVGLVFIAPSMPSLPQVGVGLLVGGMLANQIQLVLSGWVLDWIPLPKLSLMSPGDVGLGAGLVVAVVSYVWTPSAFPINLDRRELLLIATLWAAISLWASVLHHLVPALGGLARIVLAVVVALLRRRVRAWHGAQSEVKT